MVNDDEPLSGNTKADDLFERGWEEIDQRLRRLREDLELAERKGLGKATVRAIGKQLLALQKVVKEYEEQWLEFERRSTSLHNKLDQSKQQG